MSQELTVGDLVRLVVVPPYLKTAEPKPMLRPPDLVQLGEEGVVLNRYPGGAWSVRFGKGTYLMDHQYIEVVPQPPSHTILPESSEPVS